MVVLTEVQEHLSEWLELIEDHYESKKSRKLNQEEIPPFYGRCTGLVNFGKVVQKIMVRSNIQLPVAP